MHQTQAERFGLRAWELKQGQNWKDAHGWIGALTNEIRFALESREDLSREYVLPGKPMRDEREGLKCHANYL